MKGNKGLLILMLAQRLKEVSLTKQEIGEFLGTSNMQNVLNYKNTLLEAYGSESFQIIPAEKTKDEKYMVLPNSKVII